MLTACGIETLTPFSCYIRGLWLVATVLTACGIETFFILAIPDSSFRTVATVLTACGIETGKGIREIMHMNSCNSAYRLRY